jgi:hypothetical protein
MHSKGKCAKFWNRTSIGHLKLNGQLCRPIPPEVFFNQMPAPPKNLYRNTASRVETAAAIDKQLSRLEDDIRKLKIDFDIYFNGSVKRPPLEARARLESLIKRVSDNRALSYAQRYQLNTLISRFTSYRELWRRTLRARGEELI